MSSRRSSSLVGAIPDWECPECANMNFGKRTECNRCKKPKPEEKSNIKKVGVEIGKQAAEKSKGLFSADDWMCTKCGNVNWARRKSCNTCNAPKYTEVEERTGYGGGFNEREGVEYKEKEESDGEYDDFGRKKKKFRGTSAETGEGDEPTKESSSSVKRSLSKEKDALTEFLQGGPDKEEEDEDDEEEEDDGDTDKYKLFDDDDEPSKKETSREERSPRHSVSKESSSRRRSDRRSRSRTRSRSRSQESKSKRNIRSEQTRKRYPGSRSSESSPSSRSSRSRGRSSRTRRRSRSSSSPSRSSSSRSSDSRRKSSRRRDSPDRRRSGRR